MDSRKIFNEKPGLLNKEVIILLDVNCNNSNSSIDNCNSNSSIDNSNNIIDNCNSSCNNSIGIDNCNCNNSIGNNSISNSNNGNDNNSNNSNNTNNNGISNSINYTNGNDTNNIYNRIISNNNSINRNVNKSYNNVSNNININSNNININKGDHINRNINGYITNSIYNTNSNTNSCYNTNINTNINTNYNANSNIYTNTNYNTNINNIDSNTNTNTNYNTNINKNTNKSINININSNTGKKENIFLLENLFSDYFKSVEKYFKTSFFLHKNTGIAFNTNFSFNCESKGPTLASVTIRNIKYQSYNNLADRLSKVLFRTKIITRGDNTLRLKITYSELDEVLSTILKILKDTLKLQNPETNNVSENDMFNRKCKVLDDLYARNTADRSTSKSPELEMKIIFFEYRKFIMLEIVEFFSILEILNKTNCRIVKEKVGPRPDRQGVSHPDEEGHRIIESAEEFISEFKVVIFSDKFENVNTCRRKLMDLYFRYILVEVEGCFRLIDVISESVLIEGVLFDTNIYDDINTNTYNSVFTNTNIIGDNTNDNINTNTNTNDNTNIISYNGDCMVNLKHKGTNLIDTKLICDDKNLICKNNYDLISGDNILLRDDKNNLGDKNNLSDDNNLIRDDDKNNITKGDKNTTKDNDKNNLIKEDILAEDNLMRNKNCRNNFTKHTNNIIGINNEDKNKIVSLHNKDDTLRISNKDKTIRICNKDKTMSNDSKIMSNDSKIVSNNSKIMSNEYDNIIDIININKSNSQNFIKVNNDTKIAIDQNPTYSMTFTVDGLTGDFVCGKKFGKTLKICKHINVSLEIIRGVLHTFRITGPLNSVISCYKCLYEEFPIEYSFTLDRRYHKKIIGVKGSNIQKIMKNYNIYVKFMSQKEAEMDGYSGNVVLKTPRKNYENMKKSQIEIMRMTEEDNVK